LTALLESAKALQGEDRHAEALAAFERCLEAAPADSVAHFLAGLSSLKLGRWEKGVAHSRVAVALAPANAAAWSNLALGWRTLGLAAQARAAAQRAVALDARLAHAWYVLGLLDQDDGAYEAAREHLVRALELDPRLNDAHVGIGLCDEMEGRFDAALARYDQAAAADPRLAEARYHRGRLHHKSRGDVAAAIGAYRDAVAIRPDYSLAHHNLANALFLAGEFREAWGEHRWRNYRLEYERHAAAAGDRYDVPASAARHVVVLGEQGLGDTLFFLRFAPLLRERGCTLEFAGDSRLHHLLSGTGLFERLASEAPDRGETGVAVVLAGDLPLMLPEAERDMTPAPLPLRAEATRAAAARARLESFGPPPWIALAWRSGFAAPGSKRFILKEAPIERIAAELRALRATWISVQREPRAGEIEALSRAIAAPVHDLGAINEDLDDALAFMSVLDGYAGVSSTLIHLRASAGGEAHVLVPFPPEWRWMASGSSPWFPAMRVYRQDAARGWSSALASLAEDLRAKLVAKN